jgi:hypothetical protein
MNNRPKVVNASGDDALRLEKTLLVASIILYFAAMIALTMQRGDESFFIYAIAVVPMLVFPGIASWKATTSLNDSYLMRIFWLMGALLQITTVLALAALYDRCDCKTRSPKANLGRNSTM